MNKKIISIFPILSLILILTLALIPAVTVPNNEMTRQELEDYINYMNKVYGQNIQQQASQNNYGANYMMG